MPQRILRDGILDSRMVNSLSEPGEILYRRLMSVVDDYGRFELDMDIIRARCFPLQLEKWSTSRVAVHLHEISGGSPLVTVDHGGSPLVTVDHGGSPLVTVYLINSKKYLQINNFGQREQSKPKFPGPNPRFSTVDHGESPCRASRARTESESESESYPKSESNAESGNEPVVNGHSNGLHSNGNGPPWNLDEPYGEFAKLYRTFWPRVLDEDIANGYHWHWKAFDLTQKLFAIQNLRARIQAGEDGEFVKHLPDYLKSEWKRGPKQPNRRESKEEERRRKLLED